MASKAQLSQELMDYILDYVAANSQATGRQAESLLQCALASRSFHPRSQLHIFSSIELGYKTKKRTRDEKIQSLLDLMHVNPRIACYVEDLTLDIAGPDCLWVYGNRDFLDVMERICASEKPLRKLALQTDRCDEYVYALDENRTLVHPELLYKLFVPFVAPYITSLSIHRLLKVPIECVTSCVGLVDLELLHVEWQESNVTRTRGPNVIRLRSLEYFLSRAALDKILPALDSSRLRSFTVYTNSPFELDYEQRIIDRACKWLEEIRALTLEIPSKSVYHLRQLLSTQTPSVSQASLNLRATTRLRRLHAHVLFPEDNLASICQTLSTIRSGSLEDIFIDAKVGTWGADPPESIFEADWAAFCAEVARVMVANAPTFEVKLTYLYRVTTRMTWNDEAKARLGEQCQSVLARLRTDKLGLLKDGPRFSHTFLCS